jgi:uncharacterized membrane protein
MGHALRLERAEVVEPVADKLAKTPAASTRQVLSPGFWREDCVALPSTPPIQLLIGERLRAWVAVSSRPRSTYEFRCRLVKAIGGNDLPIALAEDVIAIGGLLLIAIMMTGDVWTCSRCLEHSHPSRYKRKAARA